MPINTVVLTAGGTVRDIFFTVAELDFTVLLSHGQF